MLVALGTWLSAGGACVLNMYLDRDIDAIMARTRGRAIPSGRIHPAHALISGAALCLSGLLILFLAVNRLAALLALVTLVVYLC